MKSHNCRLTKVILNGQIFAGDVSDQMFLENKMRASRETDFVTINSLSKTSRCKM